MKPVRETIVKPELARQARDELQNQGNPTRNVKQDGKWVIQELVDGVWQIK